MKLNHSICSICSLTNWFYPTTETGQILIIIIYDTQRKSNSQQNQNQADIVIDGCVSYGHGFITGVFNAVLAGYGAYVTGELN